MDLFVGLFLFGLVAFVGLISALVGLWEAAKLAPWWRSALLAALPFPLALALWPTLGPVTRDARFLFEKPAYDRVVSRVSGRVPTPVQQRRLWDEHRAQVDPLEPRRVGFALLEGIPDGTLAIVYDPTGRVGDERLGIRMFNEGSGDCRPLPGDYFRCNFD